ncbi:MAG: Ldh family oxidoreductase [bacterium]|nr:Ldh family oxidoreductase [bacterium]
MPVLSVETLRTASEQTFVRAGVSKEVAQHVVGLLIRANLAGHDSHGVVRIPGYVDQLIAGRIVPDAEVEILDETPTSARLKGNHHFGQVVLARGAEVAISKSEQAPVSLVTAYQYSHCGQLGAYAAMLTEADRVGIVLLGKQRGAVVPAGGKSGRLYQNTLAIALPSTKPFPVVLDMATCVAPFGKVLVRRARNELCPEGWLVDADGNPSRDPFLDFSAGEGGLLPLGSPQVGHKGSGLTFVLGILATALSGAGGQGEGTLIMAVNPAFFGDPNGFREEVALCVDYLNETSPIEGVDRVLAPGERSYLESRRRQAEGIYVEDSTWDKIQELASV